MGSDKIENKLQA